MIPRRYVPAWQLDMQNRGNIIKVRLVGPTRRLLLAARIRTPYVRLLTYVRTRLLYKCMGIAFLM